MKLGLGTAQFGLNYGISNQRGRIPADEVRAILALASNHGIEVLDTATAYGDSEAVIGASLSGEASFRIVTKTAASKFAASAHDIQAQLEQSLRDSLRHLRQQSVYGYLLHDPQQLFAPEADKLVAALQLLKQQGLVKKIGVSVYTATEIDRALELFLPDIVQAPVSIFDQRLVSSGHLVKLKKRGVEIHARSVFLQGLVLMPVEDMPAHFQTVAGHLEKFTRFTEAAGMSRLDAALAFIAQIEELDVALVGVSGLDELKTIVSSVKRNQDHELKIGNAAQWAIGNDEIVNPALWPKVGAGTHA